MIPVSVFMATPPKSTRISGDPVGLASRLMREFAMSPPLTGETEAYRNFLQALIREMKRLRVIDGKFQGDAARFVIDAVAIEVEVDGKRYTVAKERMWNTVPAMERRSILDYFKTIGASEGENASWAPDNLDGRFGQGLRQGKLPENHYGFIIIAVHEDGSEYMIWIEYDEEQKSYALKPLGVPTVNMDGEYEVEWESVADVGTYYDLDFAALIPDEVRKWGGMVFLSLGMAPEENTALGMADKRARHAGIDVESAIQDRLFDASRLVVAPLVTLTTDSKVGGAKFEIDSPDVTGTFRLDNRTLSNHMDWFDPAKNPGVQTTVLRHPDGTEFTIGLRPDKEGIPTGRKRERHGPAARSHIVEVVYGNDVHPLWGGRDDVETVMMLGISDKSIASRTGVIVKPPVVKTGKEVWGITQEGTRTHLYVRDGATGRQVLLANSSRVHDWREFIADNLPPFIHEALADASAKQASSTTDFKKVMRDVWSTIKARHTATSARQDPNGDVTGVLGDEKVVGHGESDQQTPDPNGAEGQSPDTKKKRDSEERPDVNCPHGCTGKFHRVDCPLRGHGGGDKPNETEVESADGKGDEPTKPKHERTQVPVIIPDPNGDEKGKTKRSRGLPDVKWLMRSAFYSKVPLKNPDEDGDHDYPCHYDQYGRIIRFNWNHRRFTDLRDYYNSTWKTESKRLIIRTHLTQDMVDDAIKEAFTEVVAGTILDLQREVKDHSTLEKRLAPENLETVTRGDFNVKYRIESLLGDYARLGSKGRYIRGGVPEPAAA